MMKRARNFAVSGALILSMAASLLAGCANDNIDSKENTETEETSSKEEVFWREQKFAEISDVTEGNPVYISEYRENIIKQPEYTYEFSSQIFSGVINDRLCFVSVYGGQELEKNRYYLDTFDLNTKESGQTEIIFDNPEIPDFSPWQCEVTGEGDMVFFAPKCNEDYTEVTNYYAVYMNAQGEWLNTLDLHSALMEFGFQMVPLTVFGDIVCDNEGYLYVCDTKLPRVGIIDETGALIDVMELEGVEGQVVCSMKSPEGIPVFEASIVRERKNTLFWYDTAKKSMQILTDTAYDGIQEYSRSLSQFGEIYNIRYNKIVRWNIASGAQERIFDCKSNGLTENSYLLKCVTNAAGELFLVDCSGKTICLYEFSDKPVEKDSNIRIADIYGWMYDENISASAASFSRKNPSSYIEYESPGAEADQAELEPYRDRVIAEIVAGKGPDILIVNGDDMKLLYEKGVLADISGVLPKETEEQIFKGVLKAGTIDGKLIGLANTKDIHTLLVSKNVWTKDTWTLEEFVDLVEEKEEALEFILEGRSYLKTPEYIVNYLALMDLSNSPFLDVEKGECYFDSQLFKRVLEIAKQYGVTEESGAGYGDYEEERRAMKESLDDGRAVAFVEYIYNIKAFSSTMSLLGEDYHCVGFPTNGPSGSYLCCDMFLVVNKAATDMDMVKKYIQYLFGEESQRKAGTDTVRKDILADFIVYRDWDTEWPWAFSMGDGVYILLESKPDGTNYVEDYIACIDGCVPETLGTQAIKDIIVEETEAYFAGAKNVSETVDVIQRRVQLYLDEQK